MALGQKIAELEAELEAGRCREEGLKDKVKKLDEAFLTKQGKIDCVGDLCASAQSAINSL